jgi:hypothetical protein
MAVCRFRPLGGVLNRKLRRYSIGRPGFLLVLHTHLLSSRRHSVVKIAFWIFPYDEITIATTKWRPRPEVTSPVDRVTMAFH